MAAHPPTPTPPKSGISVTIIIILLLILIVMLAVHVRVMSPPDFVVPEPPTTCDTRFLGPDDFQGGWVSHTPALFKIGASSRFKGTIMFANIDRDLAEDVLPATWSLAAPENPSLECHPILILFGEQSNLSSMLGSYSNPIGGDDAMYTEMMLLVPFTVRNDFGTLWHTNVIRMYLDDITALIIGNSYYAYNKELATFADTGSLFSVFASGPLVFQSTYAPTGSLQNFDASTLPNLDVFKDVLAMPLVGVVTTNIGSGTLNFDKCSYFDMSYNHGDGSHAKVRGTSTQHDYFMEFVAAMVPWIGLPPLNNSVTGAIEVENLGWELLFPAQHYCKYF